VKVYLLQRFNSPFQLALNPTTLLLLALGAVMVRTKKQKNNDPLKPADS